VSDERLEERPRVRQSRRARWFIWGFSILMLATAGSAFVMKLIEFIVTATGDGETALASFLIPVLNYLLVATGFLLLFLWAYFSGQFRDVEGPKYRMLELQQQIDAAGTELTGGGGGSR
jgi:cbb3-type cytochrome oxidase maturation protein